MYQNRFIIILCIGAFAVLFNATLIAYELPLWLAWGSPVILIAGGIYGLLRLPRLMWVLQHSRQIFRRGLEDDRAPQLLLTFFLLAFASAQAMITQRTAQSALSIFSQRFTGDDTLTWLVVGVTILLGVLVYLFRENPVFFYMGIVGVLLYVAIVIIEIASGQVSAVGLLAILYLLYGAGGNLLTLLAYRYHHLTQKSLLETRHDLNAAQGLIAQQQAEIENLRTDIAAMRREVHEYPA